RLSVPAVAKPPRQSLLQVAAEQSLLRQTDEQKVVESPQPSLSRPLWGEADLAEGERRSQADHCRNGPNREPVQPAPSVVVQAYGRGNEQQPETGKPLVEVEVQREGHSIRRRPARRDHLRVLETGEPVESEAYRGAAEDHMSPDPQRPRALRLGGVSGRQQQPERNSGKRV